MRPSRSNPRWSVPVANCWFLAASRRPSISPSTPPTARKPLRTISPRSTAKPLKSVALSWMDVKARLERAFFLPAPQDDGGGRGAYLAVASHESSDDAKRTIVLCFVQRCRAGRGIAARQGAGHAGAGGHAGAVHHGEKPAACASGVR